MVQRVRIPGIRIQNHGMKSLYGQSGENGPVISEYTYDGSYGRTKVIVCKRPDRIGYSYDDVSKMAKYIKEKYIK